jgi:LmbE family N-acetylglucosaminyl deacetylase/glycosyltransferase involved in cell wall biosynthesis/ubiquinone/menaquinone biosynthesis C-methylase UbiE
MLEEKDLIPQTPSDLTGVSVLALAAHPDDEVLGCGGALALHVQKGDPVRVLVVTGGEKGDFRGQHGEGYVSLREEEERQALAVLGIREVEFWRLPDRGLHSVEELTGRLRHAIEAHRPHLIYVPSPSEIHPDHRALAHALWEAAGAVGFAGKIAFYEVSAPLRPNTLVDITPVVEKKKTAIQCYRSQLEENDYLEKIFGLNRFRSYTLPSEVQYAEAFWVFSPSAVHPASLNQLMTEQARFPLEAKDQPLVSIIVRTKDRPKLLRNALRSIAAQTYRPIEVVMVNDGGCDLDIEELKGILVDVSLNYVRLEKNTGRAHAGNVGIENAKGEYIGFLDDDDEFYSEHVETLISCLKQGDYKVAYVDAFFVYQNYDADTYELKEVKKEIAFSQDYNYNRLIFGNYIPFICLMFDINVLIESGGLDENFDLYEDWDLLIRIGDKYSFKHITETTANYNLWSAELQISQNNRDTDFMKQSYLRVLYKHIDRVSPSRIHEYVSSHVDRFEVEKYKNQAEEMDIKINDLEITLMDKDHCIATLENTVNEKKAYIQLIHSSHGWRLLTKYYRLRDKLLPIGTKRRLLAKVFIKSFLSPKEVLKNFNITNYRRFLYYLTMTDPLTIETKVEQELSSKVTVGETFAGVMTERNIATKVASKDYFNFMFEMNTKRGADHVSLSYPDIGETDIKLIAFYLPQFHPIQENDEWWGKGFTEWTNVTRAVPQFLGHYQPRLPGELGFYDLRISDIQKRQVELARQYGIYGFCFHFYWFNGKTLLEGPLKRFTENIEFPFCINWANENWTRRWDGQENEILIGQKHSPEDDIAFIRHISKYFNNRNYIRIKSKPMLIIYRPSLFPSPEATARRWREWCLNNGVGEIYLAAIHSFDQVDPRKIGYDVAIEFPIHSFPLIDRSNQFRFINPNYQGILSNYEEAVKYFTRYYIKPSYKKFRGICPGWDNEARRPGRSTVIANSTPDKYKEWLRTLCHYTYDNFKLDERIIFINAWNEWGEGAYLEPDKRYGYAYLQATADALIEYNSEVNQKKIIYVCHDAHFHGAQLISLNIIKYLKLKFKYEVHVILKSGGALEPEYSKYSTVYNLEKDYYILEKKQRLIEYLYRMGIRDAICSTVVSADLNKLLHERGIKVITLVHELPGIIKEMKIEENARILADYSYKIVFPSDFVKMKFNSVVKIDDEQAVTLPQGLFKHNQYKNRKEEARDMLRKNFALPKDAKVVLGVGYGDRRKGIDLFVEVAKMTTCKRKDIYFIWVGNLHPEIDAMIRHEVKANKYFILQGAQQDVSMYYSGADIYLLTSREDPFPSVVLEAMDAGLPVIGFHSAGGFSDIVNENTGILVDYLNVDMLASEIVKLVDDSQRRELLGFNGSRIVEKNFKFVDYVYKLLALMGHDYKKVSVIVPNYNYARYLKSRLESVQNQTYPVYEIVFLDDLSTDNSVEVAGSHLKDGLNNRIILNESNTGSVYKQWIKGLMIAEGDYIWIAEADDLCENTFLEELMSCFEKDKDVVLAYCQSKQINENGKVIAENYLEYTKDIDEEKWREDFINDGIREIADTLVVKNTIPNVSAALFKKADVSTIAGKIINYKVVGDWFFYSWLLRHGKIAYVAKPLNYHRRHDKGVTRSEDRNLHYDEVVSMQEHVMHNFAVTTEAREKALSYRDRLKTILGIVPDIIQNAESMQCKGSEKDISETRIKQLDDLVRKIPNVASGSVSLKQLLCDVEDDFYFWLLTEGYSINRTIQALLPKMPGEQIQKTFTGRSGYATLHQAFLAYKLFKSITQKFYKNLQSCGTILDFGCGWGRITRYFLRDVAAEGLYGVDCLEEVVNICKKSNLKCNFETINIMPPTRFQDDFFDCIYLFSVFSHLSERAHLDWLLEFKRILKPGGLVIATTRPRQFILECEALRKRSDMEAFQYGAACSFQNVEQYLADYDSGKYCHSPTGGGGVLSESFYGETAIPKQYVVENWSKFFSFVDYVYKEEHQSFDQNVIIAKR